MTRGAKFRMWVVFGIACMIFWTAFYMITANLGYVPLTGKNLPLLGLDSKNDVLRYGLLIGFAIRYIEQMREGVENGHQKNIPVLRIPDFTQGERMSGGPLRIGVFAFAWC